MNTEKKYDIIVIDPPWDIQKVTHEDRPNQVDMDYKTMTLDEIKAMPIGEIGKEQSWLFLWTTQKYLWSSKEILEGWGYKFLLTMVWRKTYGISDGMPLFGFKWNAEFILVGYKGKIPLWVADKPLIPACFDGENLQHSRKPKGFYAMIETLGPDRIDVFARSRRQGWDAWGDQTERETQNVLNLNDF